MPAYPLFGVVLQSQQPLATLTANAAPAAAPTIVILRQPPTADAITIDGWQRQYVLHFRATGGEPFMSVYQGAAGYLLRVHRRADFEVAATGDRIVCRARAGVPWATVEQLLVDQVVPRALQLMGRPCVHASAVSVHGAVLALVGQAGAGKSTTTAALCQRKWSLICDDCLALQPASNGITVHPGYPSVRLWPDSADALLGGGHQLPQASPRTRKLRKAYTLPSAAQRLRCIIALDPCEGSTVSAQQLSAREAFALLATSLHRLTPHGSQILGAEFHLLSAIAAEVAVVRLRYRQSFEVREVLLAEVERVFAQCLAAVD